MKEANKQTAHRQYGFSETCCGSRGEVNTGVRLKEAATTTLLSLQLSAGRAIAKLFLRCYTAACSFIVHLFTCFSVRVPSHRSASA